jgi:hypothetical protein
MQPRRIEGQAGRHFRGPDRRIPANADGRRKAAATKTGPICGGGLVFLGEKRGADGVQFLLFGFIDVGEGEIEFAKGFDDGGGDS